jgi:Putative DNA-binding domain
MSDAPTFEREALRQQHLLRALWRDGDAADLQAWLRGAPQRQQRGLRAYLINAAVAAERALATAFPTVAALVGEEPFAALARDLWRQHAPERGDLGEWGAALPAFIADSESLASEPYLADSARLDWLAHVASRAADAPDAAPALDALAAQPPEAIGLQLSPGTAVLASAWPVALIWLAHQPCLAGEREVGDDSGRFDAVRVALAEGRGEYALVRRDGFAVRVEAIDAGCAAFTSALLGGSTLAAALDAAGDRFAFDQWLVRALQERRLVAVQSMETA